MANRYKVVIQGEVEVVADSDGEAESEASFECGPEMCTAELLEENVAVPEDEDGQR